MPLIDPRADPRLVPIPHPSPPAETPPLTYGLAPTPPPVQGPILPPPPEANTGFLGQILDILDAPRNAAWSGVPGGFQGQRASFLSRIDEPVQWLPGETNGRTNQPPLGHLAWKGLNQLGGAGLAYDVLGDPLTYLLNRGAIKAGGEALGAGIEALPGPTNATADMVVRAASLGDKLLNDAAELPLRGVIKGVGLGVKGVTSIPGTGLGMKVLDEAGERRGATSLYDWATHQSPHTALRMIARQMQNVNEQLRSQGHSLELGLGDWQGRAGRATWPGTWADAATVLNNLRDDLTTRITQAATENPHTAPVGHAIAHQIDEYRDILNSRFRELQRQHAARGTPAAQAAQELQAQMQESWQAVTDMTAGARDVFEELTRDLHGPALPGPLGAGQMAETSRKLQQRLEQLKYLHHDLPGFMADLPNQFRSGSGSWYDSLLNRSMTDYAARFKELGQHLGDFESGLKYVWGQTHPGVAFPTIAARTPKERLAQINGVLGQLQLAPVGGAGELFERLAPLLPVTDANRLKGHLATWGEDLFSKDLFDTVTGKVTREHAKRLGIDAPGPIRRIGDDALNFFKTQAIDTPAYLLNNLMGGLFMGGLRGVQPMSVMRNLAENVGTMFRGGEVQISPLRRMNDLLGLVTPHEVTSSSGSSFLNSSDDVKALLGRVPNIMERIGTPTLATAGAAQGAYSGYTDTPRDRPEDAAANTLQGAAVGGATWGTLPLTTKYLLTHLGTGLEAVMRQTAYLKGMTQGVEARAADLVAIGQQALLAPRGGRSLTTVSGIDPALRELERRGGFLSPARLEDWLSGHGVDPDTARQAGTLWGDKLQDATTEGTRLAHQIHFDYEDLTNVQQLVKNFSPFATWGMKAYPFFAEELAKHPRVALSLLRMTLDQQGQQEQQGLSDRFAGTGHVPALDQFWSAITGRPEKVFVNPMRGLFPFADLAQAEGLNENQTPVEQGIKGASALGFGIRPDLEAALGLTPLVSGSAPTRGFWRHAGPVQGATGLLGAVGGRGVDLNAPVQDAQAALRMAFRGLEPTDLKESGVLKRLDELSLRETGHPISSGHITTLPYLEARFHRQGALWDRAHGEASRESAGRSLYGVLTQIGAPKALLGQEEEKIRAAQAQRALDPEVAQALKQELRDGNRTKLRPDLVAPLTKAAFAIRARYGEAGMPREVQQILLIPTVANLETLRGWIAEEEQTTNPLNLGYSSGGSPEETRLSSALTAYYSIPFLLRQDPAFKNLPPEELAALERNVAQGAGTDPRGPYGRMQAWAKQRKDQMLAQEPVLAAYLRWQQQERGYGNPRQFMREVWGNPAKRQALMTAEGAAQTP